MNKALFEQYAELEKRKREIEAQQLEIKPMLLSDMQNNDVKTVKSDFGRFTLSEGGTWQFSAAVEQLKQQLEEKKTEEKQKKIAVKIPKPTIIFTPTKTNGNSE